MNKGVSCYFLFFLAILCLCHVTCHAEDYVVKKSDTMSEIVSGLYPKEKIYGKKGKLKKILSLNPQIKNANKIYPNQIIHLPDDNRIISSETSSLQVEESNKKTTQATSSCEKASQISEERIRDDWSFLTNYGGTYLLVNQTGALGTGKLGVFIPKDLKFQTEFSLRNWAIGFEFNTYKFKYQTSNSSGEKSIYDVALFGSHKWIQGGISLEQFPLFKNAAGNIQMEKMNIVSLNLGFKKEISLPSRKPSSVIFKVLGALPLSTSSENPEITLNSSKGFGVDSQFMLNRQIFTWQDYSLYLNWETRIGVKRNKANVQWGASKGEVNNNFTHATTAIGLLFL